MIFGAIIAFIYDLGFYPQDDDTNTPYFSHLTLVCVLVLANYLVPIILRPFDFISKFYFYIPGIISYIVLTPLFSIIIPIYSIANIHDISWGNRPSVTSERKKK